MIATQNQDSLQLFAKTGMQDINQKKWITLQPGDFSAEIYYGNNTVKKMELYYGAGYLSQSSRKIPVDKTVVKTIITSYNGSKRTVQ